MAAMPVSDYTAYDEVRQGPDYPVYKAGRLMYTCASLSSPSAWTLVRRLPIAVHTVPPPLFVCMSWFVGMPCPRHTVP